MVELRANFNARILKLENQYDIRRELININADKRALEVLASNMEFMHIRLEQVDTREANRIKQEVIKLGGEAAISQEAYSYTVRTTSMLISASRKNATSKSSLSLSFSPFKYKYPNSASNPVAA